MKLLVMSDCHNRPSYAEKAMAENPEIRDVFFLGDGADGVEELRVLFPEKSIRVLSGNCDPFSMQPNAAFERVGGVGIFFTHGHRFNVKHGVEALVSEAVKRGASLALFGHTHIPYDGEISGVRTVNPGSLSEGRTGYNSYAVIDISNGEITVEIKRI